MTAPALRLRAVERRHRRGFGRRGDRGVGPVDLELAPREMLAILGPSGSGKSTLLSLIAGLDRVDHGTIEIAGRRVDREPPGRRDIGLVEQDLPLYEHLDGRGNVAMAVSGLRLDRATTDARVETALAAAEAVSFADRRASRLSGGERARICLARILARRPAVALLDEPFSGLEAPRRHRLRELTLRTLVDAGAAVVLVSHDDRDVASIEHRLHLDEHGCVAAPESNPPTP